MGCCCEPQRRKHPSNAAKGPCHEQRGLAQFHLPVVTGGYTLPLPPHVFLQTHRSSAHGTPGVGFSREGVCREPLPLHHGCSGPAVGSSARTPWQQRQPLCRGQASPCPADLQASAGTMGRLCLMGGGEGPRLLREEKYSPTEMLRTSAGGEARGQEVGSGPTASVPRAASERRAGPAPTAESCRSAPLQGDAIPWILHQQGPADMCFSPFILQQIPTHCRREDATRNRKHIIACALHDYLTARFCRITACFGFIPVINNGVSNSRSQDNSSPST